MNENGKLQNILHCTDNDTIDKIAEKYTLSDEATSQRVYERCVQKMMAKKMKTADIPKCLPQKSIKEERCSE